MVQVNFQPEVEAMVRQVAQEWKTDESSVLEQVMLQWLEDREDYERGMRSLMATKSTKTQAEMEALAELAD